MTGEIFHDAMGYIDDDLIEEAARFRERRPRPAWQRLAALAACVCVAAGGVLVWSRYGQQIESETTGATDGATPTLAVQESYGGTMESVMEAVELLDVRYEYGSMEYGDSEPDGIRLLMRAETESAQPSGEVCDTLCLKVTERGARHKVEALVPAGEGAWELIVTRAVTDGGRNDVLVGRIYIDIPAGIVGADDTITVTWKEEE